MRAFLDTNIFLYSAGKPHPKRDGCVQILRRLAEGTLDATANTEVIQEILQVLTRRGQRAQALGLARRVTVLCSGLLPVNSGDMVEAVRLLEKHPRLSVRAAVHAATMLRNGLMILISTDPEFDQISEIRRLAPGSF